VFYCIVFCVLICIVLLQLGGGRWLIEEVSASVFHVWFMV